MNDPARRAGMAATAEDHIAIVNAVNEIGLAADLHDWARVRAQFADQVMVDYTSLAGGQPATIMADTLIESWRGFLPGFSATQHVIANHRVSVDGALAEVLSQFIANHRLVEAPGGDLWTLGGHYRHRLRRAGAGWHVVAITMTWTWQSGNADLPKLAAQAASTVRSNGDDAL